MVVEQRRILRQKAKIIHFQEILFQAWLAFEVNTFCGLSCFSQIYFLIFCCIISSLFSFISSFTTVIADFLSVSCLTYPVMSNNVYF